MIKLEVEDYCHNCGDFEPEVIRFCSDDMVYLQQIFCVNRNRCEQIYKAIKEHVRKEKEND